MIGESVGPYRVLEKLGAGGMGEVYRARDTRLDRDVAIKVSATEFSERFTREARSIAALNHSNICQVYDIGPDYLVLEYVEGVHPAGPMPFEEALPIIRQLIDGIEAAHDKGIIHRDLKTANIKITTDGVVKILDFGLAKAAEPESAIDPANSPTFTMSATQAGVIVGTAAYMAPEQAKSKPADRRSDIWSFGVVVYELLVGRAPFEGESAVEILGAVINKEPDWTAVPPRARRLLQWCLKKDRRKRLAAIADARMLLDEVEAIAPSPAVVPVRRRLLWPVAAAVLVIGASVFAYGWWNATRPIDRPLTRLSVDLGPDAVRGSRITTILSPDGTRLVFIGRADAGGAGDALRLFTRRLDEPHATPLRGTGAGTVEMPFFSPDGRSVGYFGNGVLMKIGVEGGSAAEIAGLGNYTGGAWGEDGQIVVTGLGGLSQVPASGGTLRKLSDRAAAFPDVLPGGGRVVYTGMGTGASIGTITFDECDIEVFDSVSRTTKTLVRGGYWARYLPTFGKTGHLVFIRRGTLFGLAFDPASLEVSGTPVPLIDSVGASPSIGSGGGQFAFSQNGTFVYLAGSAEDRALPIQWLDAKGGTSALLSQPNPYMAPRLSPDGTRLAYNLSTAGGSDVWVYDIARDTPTQVTFTHPAALELAWAPDSRHVVFGDGSTLWWVSADGSGQPLQLVKDLRLPRPSSFSPDGRLAFIQMQGATPAIWTVPIDLSDPNHPKPGKAESFLTVPEIVQVDPAFAPDGRFVAYASNESGREEMFVKPFPGPGGKWKVSTGGGKFPAWSRTTKELFWLGGDDRIMVASYVVQGGTFSAGRPRVWSPPQIFRDGVRQNFDISSDGTRAVIFPASAGKGDGTLHATFLLNFFDEVRRRIPR